MVDAEHRAKLLEAARLIARNETEPSSSADAEKPSAPEQPASNLEKDPALASSDTEQSPGGGADLSAEALQETTAEGTTKSPEAPEPTTTSAAAGEEFEASSASSSSTASSASSPVPQPETNDAKATVGAAPDAPAEKAAAEESVVTPAADAETPNPATSGSSTNLDAGAKDDSSNAAEEQQASTTAPQDAEAEADSATAAGKETPPPASAAAQKSPAETDKKHLGFFQRLFGGKNRTHNKDKGHAAEANHADATSASPAPAPATAATVATAAATGAAAGYSARDVTMSSELRAYLMKAVRNGSLSIEDVLSQLREFEAMVPLARRQTNAQEAKELAEFVRNRSTPLSTELRRDILVQVKSGALSLDAALEKFQALEDAAADTKRPVLKLLPVGDDAAVAAAAAGEATAAGLAHRKVSGHSASDTDAAAHESSTDPTPAEEEAAEAATPEPPPLDTTDLDLVSSASSQPLMVVARPQLKREGRRPPNRARLRETRIAAASRTDEEAWAALAGSSVVDDPEHMEDSARASPAPTASSATSSATPSRPLSSIGEW